MNINLSFWRFVIHLDITKSGLWTKGNNTFWFHMGTFTNGKDNALSLIILPLSFKIGFAKKKNTTDVRSTL